MSDIRFISNTVQSTTKANPMTEYVMYPLSTLIIIAGLALWVKGKINDRKLREKIAEWQHNQDQRDS